MEMTKSTLGIRLDDDTQVRLKTLGQKRDRSPHYLMKEAIEEYLRREETLEAEKALMQARWEKYELTGETVDHSKVKAWANSLGKPASA